VGERQRVDADGARVNMWERGPEVGDGAGIGIDRDDRRHLVHVAACQPPVAGSDFEHATGSRRRPDGSQRREPLPLGVLVDQSISVRSGATDFNAFARLPSAISSVLRDVAMFMRMWFAPPSPYDAPWFR